MNSGRPAEGLQKGVADKLKRCWKDLAYCYASIGLGSTRIELQSQLEAAYRARLRPVQEKLDTLQQQALDAFERFQVNDLIVSDAMLPLAK